MELKEFLNNKALKAAYNDEDNDRGGHFTYWFDCSPFDDAENTLIGWIEEYIKLTNDDLKPVEIPEISDNSFSGQSATDLCCGVYEEPPLELKICTRCNKEFKSNIDCPVCPSCYL